MLRPLYSNHLNTKPIKPLYSNHSNTELIKPLYSNYLNTEPIKYALPSCPWSKPGLSPWSEDHPL